MKTLDFSDLPSDTQELIIRYLEHEQEYDELNDVYQEAKWNKHNASCDRDDATDDEEYDEFDQVYHEFRYEVREAKKNMDGMEEELSVIKNEFIAKETDSAIELFRTGCHTFVHGYGSVITTKYRLPGNAYIVVGAKMFIGDKEPKYDVLTRGDVDMEKIRAEAQKVKMYKREHERD